jgi:two-component system, NarL family, sensor histidine kinase BarA
MSYRTVKRLLGETGLEFKCRMLFATGLLILITGSFYSYSQLNLRVVRGQQRERAQLIIAQNLQSLHWKRVGANKPGMEDLINQLTQELKPQESREDRRKFIPVNYQDSTLYGADSSPSELAEAEAFAEIIDQGKEFVARRNEEAGTYEYYQRVTAGESCLRCHGSEESDGNKPYAKAGVFGVAKITFPQESIDSQVGYNMGILWATAIVTAVLAMVAAAIIVRYVIVKPVQHLNEVSEAIAQGDLDQRADIRTGDEFEELSHAFNRMLRHLVTIQDELRQVNSSLDAKVDELAQANLSLHQLNRLKSEFLATMSHELRTPLNSILGFSDVLSTASNLTDRQKKYLLNIVSSGQHLLALINDILDLAKMEAGRMELHPTEVSVSDFIEHVTASILPLAERKNIDLQSEVDPGTPLLRQDLGKLQQIMNNLLSNAVKFTPEGGRIRVSALPVGSDMVELNVADTGVGIPLEDQAAIFEKFRQGRHLTEQNDSLTREYEGTGLGLSIVKELTRLLGGEVFLDSEFGKGSTFTVRLPVQVEAPFRDDEDAARSAVLSLRVTRSEPSLTVP